MSKHFECCVHGNSGKFLDASGSSSIPHFTLYAPRNIISYHIALVHRSIHNMLKVQLLLDSVRVDNKIIPSNLRLQRQKTKIFFSKKILFTNLPSCYTNNPNSQQCHPDQAVRTHRVIPGQLLVEATHPLGIVITIQTAMVLTTTKMTTAQLTTKTHLEAPLTHLQVGIKRTIDTTVSITLHSFAGRGREWERERFVYCG